MPRLSTHDLAVSIALGTCCTLPSGAACWAGENLSAAIAQCRSATDKNVAIDACSVVIGSTRDPVQLERAYNRRGRANEAVGRFNAAADDYTQTIRLDPKIAGYFDNRMRAYKALGLTELALRDADTAVRLAPTYSFAFRGRGAVRFDRGEYELAVKDYSAALSIDKADASLLVDRGLVLMKLGRVDQAVADFTQAHFVDPAFTPALRERGIALARTGKDDQARADLLAALAVNPQDQEIAAALRTLDQNAGPGRTTQDQSPKRIADGSNPSALSAAERAEEEARRKLQEQQDAAKAYNDAALRLKEERFARAKTEGLRIRGEASDFVRANRDDPQLMEHLQRITDLSKALAGTEPALVERASAALAAGLKADPIYLAYSEQNKLKGKQEAERTLAEIVRNLRVQKTFLINVVVQDPTSADASTFLTLAKQADAVLAAPELDRAQTLMGTIDAAIGKAKLNDGYAAARQAAAAEERAAVSKSSSDKGSVR